MNVARLSPFLILNPRSDAQRSSFEIINLNHTLEKGPEQVQAVALNLPFLDNTWKI